MKSETKSVRLELIRMDGGTQTRAALNDDAVADYSEAMTNGAKFPPVILFYDGSVYWLADGFHRCHACRASGFLDVLAEVHFGTRREAIKHAIQANQTGSVRRTNADKRKCVEIALANFADLSDRAIADLCGVHHAFVAKNRPQVDTVSTSETQEPQTRTGKDGKEYPAPKQEEPEPEQDEESNDDSEPKKPKPKDKPKPTENNQPKETLEQQVAREQEAAFNNLCIAWVSASRDTRTNFLLWVEKQKHTTTV